MAGLTSRLAGPDDIPALDAVMDAAIAELQRGFLSPAQIAAGTYFVVEADGRVAGCGGWSRRATLYGGDHSPGRDAALLDPAKDAARVRAMYTHPDFARRGVGRLILALCEEAAGAEGFTRLELMGTMSGQPLYLSAGYTVIEQILDDRGGEPVPLARMGKSIA